ncbi:hypothetical protein [Akkermansia muciniphila]|uniref:hypothetical protein n=1 Tax=Akkermansia muciniphila TaxID=239935 RepID=UPI000B8E9DDA|nr:hypothetical protein [Akkermansia muciniphila]
MVELNTWAGLEPAVMDIKTVSGLAQVFELTLTDSAGSVVDLEGVTFRGAVNTAPLRELMCSAEGGKVLFGWSGLPAGRHSFDLFLVTGQVEKALVRGAFVVSGRVMPPLDQESYSVNHAATLVLPDTADGIILVELSEVGLVDLLSRKAGAFAEEARGHVSSIRELKEFIVQKLDGFEDVVVTATTAITEAGKSAVASVESTREEAVQAVEEAKETATTTITEAGKSAVASVESTREEAVQSVEEAKETATTTITEAGKSAVSSVESGREEAVQSVEEAKETATTVITEAGKSAVASVESTRRDAVGTITLLVQRAETAKEAIVQAENRINEVGTNAATSATNAANSATAAQQALAAMPQVDASGNMTLAGNITAAGGTFDGTVNANGGVNIPQAVGAPTNESGVNRLYASGLAAVTEAFASQSFLSSFNSYGAAATVEQTVPGWCFRLKQTAEGSCTIKVHFLNPFLGVSNYSGWCGFVLPLAAGNTGSTVARKISFSIGKRGSVVEKTAESLDMFTLSPAPGSTASFPRFVDVTFYLQSDASSSPAGYPVRVRELMYDTAARKWVVHETQSVIPSFNTNPSATMFLACVQNRVATSGAEAGLWIGSNAYDTRRLLCIADLHALQDSFDFTGVDRVYWDSSGINAFSFIGAMRQLTVPGYNQPNGSYAAFRALETRLIQSTSTYEFTPYE